jgi:hypothetical protein
MRNGAARETGAASTAPGVKLPASECTAADSSASASVIGGIRPGRRCASIDLPAPGGPLISKLWPPAAATSSARLACAWPLTSARSGYHARVGVGDTANGARISRPARWAQTCSRVRAGRMFMPSISAASGALSSGRTKARAPLPPAWRWMAAHIASVPRTARKSPESASSPANSWSSRLAALTCPEATRMPSAIGRSKRPDSLGRSAGARLTVMRRCGKLEAAVLDCGAHAVARFLDFGIGQADQGE